MVSDALAALLPLALGHDQEASACPWVALTRQTADYPSRKAQAAMAIANGLVPPTADLVDILYRCDLCGRCRANSTLPGPPDLARALWSVRASLVEVGAVPEVSALADRFSDFGNLYGDLSEVVQKLGCGDTKADILYVPGASMLACAPDVAISTLKLLRNLDIRIDLQTDVLDSGQELRELGLSSLADHVQVRIRQRMAEAVYQLVIAGTPKEAFGLQMEFANCHVKVRYAGEYIAELLERLPRSLLPGTTAVVFHPTEVLLHRSDGFQTIDRWLAAWLGDRYRREPDPMRNAWPAAIERPSPRVREELAHRLALQRMNQLLAGRVDGERLTILTTDPFSLKALGGVAPPNVEVIDLIVFASQLLRKEDAVGG